jgi:predicted ATPase
LTHLSLLDECGIYEKSVFFIENLGFCTPTDARKISYEESLNFEKIHLDIYEKFGYKCIKIPAMETEQRIQTILRMI